MFVLTLQARLFRIWQAVALTVFVMFAVLASTACFAIADHALGMAYLGDTMPWTQVWLVSTFGLGGVVLAVGGWLGAREILSWDIPRRITRAQARLRRQAYWKARREHHLARLRAILDGRIPPEWNGPLFL